MLAKVDEKLKNNNDLYDKKYLDYEACIANSSPKRECNKIVTMLKKDLSKMNKALDKVNKKCPKGKVINSKTGICSKIINQRYKKNK